MTIGDPLCVAYSGAVNTVLLLLLPVAIAAIVAGVGSWIIASRLFRTEIRSVVALACSSAVFGVCGGLLAGVNRGTLIGAAIPAFVTIPLAAFGFFSSRRSFEQPVARTMVVLVGLALSISFGYFYGSAAIAKWELLDFDTGIYKNEVELLLTVREAAAMKLIETGKISEEAYDQLVRDTKTEHYRFGSQPCFKRDN